MKNRFKNGHFTDLQPTREELNREMEYIHAMNRAKDRRTLTNHSAEPKPKSPWTQISNCMIILLNFI